MKNLCITYFNLSLSVKASLLIFFLSASLAQATPATEINLKANGKYIRSYYLALMKKTFVQNGKKKALIIGDSHAQDFLNAVHENGYLSQYQISTRYIPTRCQIFLGKGLEKNIAPKDKALCKASDNLQRAIEHIKEADLVILSAKWRIWSANLLPQTIKNLTLSPNQKLVVIGTKSFGRYSPSHYQGLSKEELLKRRTPVDNGQDIINRRMRDTLNNTIFVDVQRIVCGASNTCPVFTDQLQPISIDGGHLTKEGAKYLGQKLFRSPVLAVFK